jgi:hypothetical protein
MLSTSDEKCRKQGTISLALLRWSADFTATVIKQTVDITRGFMCRISPNSVTKRGTYGKKFADSLSKVTTINERLFHETRACSTTEFRENRTDETSVVLGQWRTDGRGLDKKKVLHIFLRPERNLKWSYGLVEGPIHPYVIPSLWLTYGYNIDAMNYRSMWWLPALRIPMAINSSRRSSQFLGAFAKLRRATISFMSVRPSVRMELGSYWTDFYEIWYLMYFSKGRRENSGFVKMWQEYGYLTLTTTYICDISADSSYIIFFYTEVVERIKTHI